MAHQQAVSRLLAITSHLDSRPEPGETPGYDGATPEIHLCEHCQRLDFNDIFFGDPRKRITYSLGKPVLDQTAACLGSMLDVSQRASEGCSLCALSFDERISEVRGGVWDEVAEDLDSGSAANRWRAYLAVQIDRDVLLRLGNGDMSVYPLKVYVLIVSNGLSMSSVGFPTKSGRRLGSDALWIEVVDHSSTCSKAIGTSSDFQTLRNWFQDCLDSHPNCRKELVGQDIAQVTPVRPSVGSFSFGNAYLHLEQGTNEGFKLIHVSKKRITKVDSLSAVEYATLSYVWGSKESHCILRKTDTHWANNSSEPEGYIKNLDDVPASIRDAMTVTTEMGLDYLWVDSLCIFQDDREDVLNQIRKMAEIYMNATLCIVAATDDPVSSGLRGVSVPRDPKHQALIRVLPDLILATSQADIYKILSNSIWATRGWTYQEYMLSRRSLIFTKSEIFYHCGTSTQREYLTRAIEPGTAYNLPTLASTYFRYLFVESDNLHAPQAAFSLRSYEMCVMEYSRRTLTYSTDALHAFAGVMDIWGSKLHTKMLFGHPHSSFLKSLCWDLDKENPAISLGAKRRRSTRNPGLHRTTVNRPIFPSWSWAAWEGPIRFSSDHYSDFSPLSSVVLPTGATPCPGLPSAGYGISFASERGRAARTLSGMVPLITEICTFTVEEMTGSLSSRVHVNIRDASGYYVCRQPFCIAREDAQALLPGGGEFILLGSVREEGEEWYAVLYVRLVGYVLPVESDICDIAKTFEIKSQEWRDLVGEERGVASGRKVWLARRVGVAMVSPRAWKEASPERGLVLLG